MSSFTFEAQQQVSYKIQIEAGCLDQAGRYIKDLVPPATRLLILSDSHVRALYAGRLSTTLQESGFSVLETAAIEPGEPSKSLQTALRLWDQMAELGFRRRDVIVALGGGVVTDLAGFTAAGYMRGVAYINIPTTLVAQIDAAIGSKVGVNHKSAKNLIGAFHHPLAVWIDPETLDTLPAQELRQGLAEVLKVAIVESPALFRFVEDHLDSLKKFEGRLFMEILGPAISAKIKLLASDLYENDLRRALNFGHTIGHALETALTYQGISHGDAIAIGMATATRISHARGLCSTPAAQRILSVLEAAELPVTAPAESDQVWQALSAVSNIRDGHFYEVLPIDIGKYTFSDDLSKLDLEQFLYAGGLK